MAAISPALRDVLHRVIPNDIDEGEALEVLREVRAAPKPVETLRAIFSGYGDEFTAGGLQALETAAVVMGADALAGILKSYAAEGSAASKARSTVASLRTEISSLETKHTAAKTKVDSLVNQIEGRKSELKRQREKKRNQGMIFAAFGYYNAAAVSLVTMINDDSRIKSLNGELTIAKSNRDSVLRALDQYKATKTTLEKRLGALQTREAELDTSASKLAGQTPQRYQNLVSARATLQRRELLLGNLKEQIQLLTALRDSASSVNTNLTQLVSDLEGLLGKAEGLVKESQQELHELMNMAVAEDPDAAAQKWLKKKVTAAQKKIFKDLNLDVNAYVKQLVAKASPGQGPAAQLLRQELTQAIKAQLNG